MVNIMCIVIIFNTAIGIKMLACNYEGRFYRKKLSCISNSKILRCIINKTKLKIKEIKFYKNEKEADREIYEAISFMRNIISLDREKQISSDSIIENLSQKEGVLQETYIKMLSLLRLNKKREAQQLMSEKFKTLIGKEFSGLLIKWDEINPLELSEILLSHQKSIKEMRVTQQRRKDESISDLLYFPVILNVVLIFINFIYVGYFIDQKEILQLMF